MAGSSQFEIQTHLETIADHLLDRAAPLLFPSGLATSVNLHARPAGKSLEKETTLKTLLLLEVDMAGAMYSTLHWLKAESSPLDRIRVLAWADTYRAADTDL